MKPWALLALVLLVPSALAHAEPSHSEPASGIRLDAPPTEARVTFTEPVYADGSWIQVLDADGNRVDNDDLVVIGQQRPEMTVTLPPLPDGAYRIAWQTYSVTDGHTVQGSIGFAIGGFLPPETEVQAEAAFDTVPSMGRALLYAGFSAGLGALVYAVWMKQVPQALLMRGGAVMALAGTAILVWDTWQGTGLGFTAYMNSPGGTRMASRLPLLGLILGATFAWTHRLNQRSGWQWTLIGAWVIAAYQSASWGHVTKVGPWGVWLELVHLLAASTWIGGLAAFFLQLRREADPMAHGRRFGRLAAVTVVVLGLSGAALTASLLSTTLRIAPTEVWSDSWTWFLVAKIVGFVMMIGAAALNRYGYLVDQPPGWLRHLLPRGGLRRVVAFETGVAALVLVAAGLLLSVSPPQASVDADPFLERTGQGDSFTALMQISPEPLVGGSHGVRFFINDPTTSTTVENNTCGRDDCIKMRWQYDHDPGSEQEAVAIPEGNGWWHVEAVLFTQPGNVTATLDIQTGYVYLDSIQFADFAV